MTNARKVFVTGVGMTLFGKLGAIERAHVDYVYGDSATGQKTVQPLGMTGIPAINANNDFSTGPTALCLARPVIASGACECSLALGLKQMNPGALGTMFNDKFRPFEDFDRETEELIGMTEFPLALRHFGAAGLSLYRPVEQGWMGQTSCSETREAPDAPIMQK